MSTGAEALSNLEIASDNVAPIGTTAASKRVSILVAARTRILGEALADVLLRTGYDVHLAPLGCEPRTIVVKAREIQTCSGADRPSDQVPDNGNGRSHCAALP